YDALSELANLSQQLQSHSITLLRADQLLNRRVLASFKDTPGDKLEEALKAQALGHFGSVPLASNSKLTPINAKQFLQSLINNMEKRLSFEGEMLHDLSVLDTHNWPSTPGIRHGEAQVKRAGGSIFVKSKQLMPPHVISHHKNRGGTTHWRCCSLRVSGAKAACKYSSSSREEEEINKPHRGDSTD
ncbi:hypothetical protein IRJ41_023910, partial [Triplophysa rosa]